ncbi:hypothetical protein HF086_003027 [Spodoptera exigua]|uniref:Secreted protein n=1 Tax=Spodoptera exigua TaxID=7107 RepID=A0A922SJV0_SPOEX|nr:hypothetical protein HF086_003027 [Spodoptera exigua]
MRFALLILLVTSLVLCDYCESKQFTRCGLAKTLSQIKGMKKTFLGTLLKNSKQDIPSEWCKEGKRGGRCNIKCEGENKIITTTQNTILIFNNTVNCFYKLSLKYIRRGAIVGHLGCGS